MNETEKDTELTPFAIGLSWARMKARRKILRLLCLINKIKVPGFRGVGMYDVARFFVHALADRNFTLSAAAMAFRFFFALFPGMIFLFTLLPYIPVEGLQDEIVAIIAQGLPKESVVLIDQIVMEVFSRSKVGILSFNLLLALFTSIGGIKALMFAFSKDEVSVFSRRNFFAVHAIAIVIFFVLIIALTSCTGIWIGAEYLEDALITQGFSLDSNAIIGLHIGKSLSLLLMFFLATSFIFYLGPETHERFSFFSPGSILSSTLVLLAIYAFNYFITNFANYGRFYGSLSTIMVLMVWFYWVSIVLMIGFELNAAIELARKLGRRIRPLAPIIKRKRD